MISFLLYQVCCHLRWPMTKWSSLHKVSHQDSPFLCLSFRRSGRQMSQEASFVNCSLDWILSFVPGLSSQMPGVVSPHELLQKLQLVQQEQSLASQDSPRLCPGLAPRFLGPTESQGADSSAGSAAGPVTNQTVATAGQPAPLQFQASTVNSVCSSLLTFGQKDKIIPFSFSILFLSFLGHQL